MITVPGNRWERVDIKTVGAAAQRARQAEGAARPAPFEAWFVDDDGFVTEGVIDQRLDRDAGRRAGHAPADHGILRGITRMVLLDATAANAIRLEERAFTVSEAHGAREAFITSATATVTPVIAIDGRAISGGKPGKVTRQLQEAFYRHSEVAPLRSGPAVDGLQRGHFPR